MARKADTGVNKNSGSYQQVQRIVGVQALNTLTQLGYEIVTKEELLRLRRIEAEFTKIAIAAARVQHAERELQIARAVNLEDELAKREDVGNQSGVYGRER